MNFAKFCELTKLERSLFTLPFLLTTFLLPGFHFELSYKIFLVLPAFFSARISGMAFNQWIDWKIDAKNPRTAKRLLPSGQMEPKEAARIAFGGLGIFLVAACSLGIKIFFLSLLAALLISSYSFMKRVSYLCHFVLGAIYFLAPLLVWMLFEEVNLTIIFLSLSAFFLISGSDVIYALQDITFDKKEGLRSIPARFGEKKAFKIAIALHLLFLISLFLLWLVSSFTLVFLFSLFFSFLFFLYLYTRKRVDERVFSLCNVMVPFFVLGGTLMDLLWRAS